MYVLRPLPVIWLLLLLSGCMVSEQIGEPIGRGRHLRPSEDVTIHFDTQFNRILLFGRSAALVGLAFWIFSAFGKKPIAILVAVGAGGFAGWLVINDYPALTDYHIEVAPSGLVLIIPPEPEIRIPWESIETMELAGYEWASVGGGTRLTPFGHQRVVGVELPDWETMDITLTGGQKHTINLKRLSVEHRQIFSNALIKRAGLVEEK